MKTLLVLVTILSGALLTMSMSFSLTPTPIQSGAPADCHNFAQAMPGDTCVSFASRIGLSVADFLDRNPQVGGQAGCPQNVYGWFWYCLDKVGHGAPSTNSPSASYVKSSVVISLPGTTVTAPAFVPSPSISKSLPPSTTFKDPIQGTTYTATKSSAPPPTTAAPEETESYETDPNNTETPEMSTTAQACPSMACYRAFAIAKAAPASSSQSTFCLSVLYSAPPVTEDTWTSVKGLGFTPQLECSFLGNAHMWVSRYCVCWMAGQLTGYGYSRTAKPSDLHQRDMTITAEPLSFTTETRRLDAKPDPGVLVM